MSKASRNKNAPETLIALKNELGGWRAVEKKVGTNRAYLSQIANGKRKPSNKVLLALGLPLERVPAKPCDKCGQLHEFRKRCPSQPKRARRKYDISFKRLRELMNSPYSQS